MHSVARSKLKWIIQSMIKVTPSNTLENSSGSYVGTRSGDFYAKFFDTMPTE